MSPTGRPRSLIWCGALVAAGLLLADCAAVGTTAPGSAVASRKGSSFAMQFSAPRSTAGGWAPRSSPIASSAPAPVSAAAKANYELAAAEAHRLHDLAARPAGAVTIDRQPAKLPESAMGTPGSGSLIDVVSFWAVPLSQHDSDAWIAAHAPAGLQTGFGSPGVGGPAPADIVTGTGFIAPNAPAWNGAALEESVAVIDSHHSVWRVEGTTVWLDPTPVRAHPTGPTMRVTVSGKCPATDKGIVGVANEGSALHTALLPAGHPTPLACAPTRAEMESRFRCSNRNHSPGLRPPSWPAGSAVSRSLTMPAIRLTPAQQTMVPPR